MIDQKPKDKVVAILLCLFLGGFGVHNFYLGYTGRGIAQLLILIFSIPLAFLFIGLLLGLIILSIYYRPKLKTF